jgi:hypothetical protein
MKRAEQIAEADPDVQAEMNAEGVGTALAKVSADSVALGGFEGDVGDVGMQLPYMQISHAQGKLEAFRKGSVVIGNDNLIANPGDKLLLTLLAARVYWKEYVSGDHYDPNRIPKTFPTKAEVLAAGGRTEWTDGLAPTYKMALAIKALVKQPDGIVCGLFGVRIGDADYAPVRWNLDKTACARVAPIVKSSLAFSLRNRGMHSGIFEMTTQSVKFQSGFSAFVPNLRLVGYHTDSEVKQILDLFRVDQAEAVDITET